MTRLGAVRLLISCLIIALGSLVVEPAAAEPSPAVRIGIVLPDTLVPFYRPSLVQALGALGYVDGDNISLQWKPFEGSPEQARPLVAELLGSQVNLIVAVSTPAARVAMDATKTIPVVFVSGDPVGMGLAASLARPGANGTGISLLARELTAKRMELLRQLLPRAQSVLYLRNPSNPLGQSMFAEAKQACDSLRLRLKPLDTRTAEELDATLNALRTHTADAVVVSEDLLFLRDMEKIARKIREARLPVMFPWTNYHEYGALMTYGTDLRSRPPQIATFVDRILRGAKPSEVPVEQVSKYDLVIDLRVARELKLKVPRELLLRADDVIK